MRWAEYCSDVDAHFTSLAKAEIKAEQERGGDHKPILQRPSRHQYKYDLDYLELGRQIEDLTSKPILNPSDLNITALWLADRAWMIDMNQYRRELAYFVDFEKRPQSLK